MLVLAACARGADDPVLTGDLSALGPASSTTALPTTTTEPAPTTTTPPTTVAAPAPTTSTSDAPRPVVDPAVRLGAGQAWVPYADAGGVVLLHPSNVVEWIGFHESAHDGARVQSPLPSAVRHAVLESRDRGTGGATAADIVVQPGTPIRAPVTGVVKRGGGYTLYCDTPDEYVVITPDAQPAWEVKILHMNGVRVAKGQRVEAGVTEIAQQAHLLPFRSQVDEVRRYDPAWPHVHVEVVDPSIPDRPTPGAGC